MIHPIILLVLGAFMFVLPFIYRRSWKLWSRFYLAMASREENRKRYVLVLGFLILSVNFLQYRISGPNLWLIPGFVTCLLSLKFRFMDAVLRWLRRDRMLQYFALAFFFLASMDSRLFTLAMSFALTIDFSFFYPSKLIIELAGKKPEVTARFDIEQLAALYFFFL